MAQPIIIRIEYNVHLKSFISDRLSQLQLINIGVSHAHTDIKPANNSFLLIKFLSILALLVLRFLILIKAN
ncbi:hypothetical protein [Vibrio gallaecicus]|uniref:hypothetical protein n=1 Tax=Vibrio gallaecicus TaxID=552386 RepID=UPI0025B40336|nr:hypothetical protein [Vibrio gallaecicus]MDN3616054.1 hypothetical protein [Vibrio gallaecicus]